MNGLKKLSFLLTRLENNRLKKLDSEGDLIEVEFKINRPATPEDILFLESQLGYKLPESYTNFLGLFNGAILYDYDHLDGFVVLGTNDIVEINNEAANTYEEDWIDTILIFIECIGEGNYLGFDTSIQSSEYPILDCFHEELPKDWKIIAQSFDEFLTKLVENEGRKYWLH